MKVIAVFKTHVDIGFTDLPRKILKSYSSRLLQRVVEACEKSADTAYPLVWTMPAFVLHYVLRHARPELKARTEALIRADRIVWHALPCTLRTEFFKGYELRETLYYAKELSRIYEKPMPISAKMTDVPGHTQALVDVLCENGIRFLHLGCNPASTPPDVPRLFFWESKSHNRILVCYDRDYGGNVVPPEGYPFPVHLSMNVSGDNKGVQPIGEIERLATTLKEYDPEAQLTVGTMDDFARELLACDLSSLPTIRGELGDTWTAGIGSFPEATIAIGKGRAYLESAYRFLKAKGDNSFDGLEREYFENMMLFGEHSGGVDVKRLITPRRAYEMGELLLALKTQPYLYAESGWNDERKWAYTARRSAMRLKREVEKKYGVSFTRVTPVCLGNYQISVEDGSICLRHRDGRVIRICYLYEIIGRECIDRYLDNYLTQRVDWSLADFGRYKMDGTNTYPEVDDMRFHPTPRKVRESARTASVCYRADEISFDRYGNAEQIQIRARCEGEGVRVSITLRNKQPTLYAEGGYLCFDLGDAPRDITLSKSGVEIQPLHDLVPRANSALFAVDYVKVDGVKIAPQHSPLVCFGEGKIYRNNTKPFEMPENGRVLFNLFNNMWATGCPQWIQGSFTYEFTVS